MSDTLQEDVESLLRPEEDHRGVIADSPTDLARSLARRLQITDEGQIDAILRAVLLLKKERRLRIKPSRGGWCYSLNAS